MAKGATGMLCRTHGGDLSDGNRILCDACARQGILACSCGSHARYFGEALAGVVSCESCDAFIFGVDVRDLRERWNRGERGLVESQEVRDEDH